MRERVVQRRRVIGRRRWQFLAVRFAAEALIVLVVRFTVASVVCSAVRVVGSSTLLVVLLVALVAARQLVGGLERLAVHACIVAVSYRVI